MSGTRIDFSKNELMRKIKKVRPGVWEIPKNFRPYMNVPVRIYMTDKLLDKTEPGAIQQGINVASLPGIVGASIMLPDAHWGYGFSIGGVAAFDLEEGVISPGGVGYDINCLWPGARVLSEFGFWVRVGELPGVFERLGLKVFDVEEGHNDASGVVFVAERGVGKGEFAVRLVTESGKVIEGSRDHPVLTRDGYKELIDVSEDDFVIVYPFEGVEFEGREGVILDESDFGDVDPQVVRYLKNLGLLPLRWDDYRIGIVARLLGFAFGDGHLGEESGRITLSFYGDVSVLERVKKDLERLGVKASLYVREREYSIDTSSGHYEGVSVTGQLKVSSRSFAILFEKLGMPRGRKTLVSFHIPDWIKSAPLWIKRNFLVGLFDSDGSNINFVGKTPTPISLTQTKKVHLKENLLEFLNEVSELLGEFGIKTTIYEVETVGDSVTYRLSIVGEESIRNYLGKINYEYSLEKKERGLYAYAYLRYKEHVKELRRMAAEKAKRIYERTKSLRKAYEAVKHIVNKRFVERTIYSNPKDVRVPEDFPTFEEYVKERAYKGGFVLEKVTRKEIVQPKYDKFYDIGVEHKAHNFIAEGIVVHNCGVRFLVTNLTVKDVKPRAREVLRVLEKYIAAGVGRGGRVRLSESQMNELLENGAVWAVENGYGFEEDLRHIEDGGRIEGANAAKVSHRAKKRGFDQVGSLGSGNHYAEVEVIQKIYDEKAAKRFGIYEEGQIGVMIHTGSRGLGHQVASDYIDVMMRAVRKYNLRLRDRQLACAPFQSPEAQDYLAAMRAAANFAFANRQILTHWVRQAFYELFGDDVELKLLYDVAHNIAKIEKHTVDGETVKVVVHRKGATRGFAPGRPEIPEDYRDLGQPILVGGSMREGSYILLGTETAMKEVFGSTVHGAGRTLSRKAAKRRYRDEQIRRELEKMGILVSAASRGEIAEESPDAYKSLEEVVESAVLAGIAKRVVKTKPIIVRKG